VVQVGVYGPVKLGRGRLGPLRREQCLACVAGRVGPQQRPPLVPQRRRRAAQLVGVVGEQSVHVQPDPIQQALLRAGPEQLAGQRGDARGKVLVPAGQRDTSAGDPEFLVNRQRRHRRKQRVVAQQARGRAQVAIVPGGECPDPVFPRRAAPHVIGDIDLGRQLGLMPGPRVTGPGGHGADRHHPQDRAKAAEPDIGVERLRRPGVGERVSELPGAVIEQPRHLDPQGL